MVFEVDNTLTQHEYLGVNEQPRVLMNTETCVLANTETRVRENMTLPDPKGSFLLK